jgi:hypothetical protein
MQSAYRQEFDTYWGNGEVANQAASTAYAAIHIEIMPPARYTYTMVAAANSFTCTATSGILDDDATVDTWTINDAGVLLVTSDDANF